MIRVVGDSHLVLFVGGPRSFGSARDSYDPDEADNYKEFCTYTVPDIQAYHLHPDTEEHHGIRLFDLVRHLPEDGAVLVSAGEIDCRGPILNVSYRTGRTIENVAEECAYRYLAGIQELRNDGWNMMMYAPIPNHCVDRDKESIYIETGMPVPEHLTTLEWCEAKTEAVKIFNWVIKESNLPVVSLVDWIFENDIVNDSLYWRDTCHLNLEIVVPQLKIEFAKLGFDLTFEKRRR